jgi:hypothetical protein
MNQPLQCRCGTVRGFVGDSRSANRVICYCKDCQAFAHFLGRANEILDERGGSDVIQVLPKNVTFTQGIESLACIRLKPKGLVRWYARCCNTPVGNTLATSKLSFVGLVHNCLEDPNAFGPVGGWVNTSSAKGEPKPKDQGLGKTARWFITKVLKARFNGDYKRTPFFRRDSGTPIVTPRVLSTEEHTAVMYAVRAST